MTKVDPYTARTVAKIERLHAEFLQLEARSKGKGPDAEERFNQAASEFRKNREALEKSLKELQSSGERTVKEKRKEIDRALKEFDTSLEKTRYQFS